MIYYNYNKSLTNNAESWWKKSKYASIQKKARSQK